MTETRIFTGFEMAETLLKDVADRVERLGRKPRCVALIDNGNAGALAYARRMTETAEKAGIVIELRDYPGDMNSAIADLETLRDDKSVDAVMPLMPMPEFMGGVDVSGILGPIKDADGQHQLNAGAVALGRAGRMPATAQACLLILKHLLGDLAGREVVIVGGSPIVGRPLALALIVEEATVTVCQKATRDLKSHTRNAEIVVSATGVPGLITADHIAEGAILLDVGIIRTKDGLVGDIKIESVTGKAALLSHVPDGVGPITTACLFASIVSAAEEAAA